jgi:hypothetical protein
MLVNVGISGLQKMSFIKNELPERQRDDEVSKVCDLSSVNSF